jgi:predicted ribosome quality control (RQC) complex YloA/Tae2 family protein
MAFDGITIAAVTKECSDTLTGGRISKIAQPEPDALLITVKMANGQKKLLLSADASLPLIYLTDSNKMSPVTAPGFCMLLRKHLQSARITGITQPGLERAVHINIEHLNEMGDLCRKSLIIEIMGKHSNIIFCDEDGTIIDSIKHISAMVSSVREVLPGKPYFLPETQGKSDALSADATSFMALISGSPMPVFKALYCSYQGFSPVIAQEICQRAGIDPDCSAVSLTADQLSGLYRSFSLITDAVRNGRFTPVIYYSNGHPEEYAAVQLTSYSDLRPVPYDSMSSLLETYYSEKEMLTRIRQKSADLRHIVQTILERDIKKYDLQAKQLADTEKRDKYRIYGELLHTYGYNAAPGAMSLCAVNYYDGSEVTIPLDPTKSASENAKHYFEKYDKLKRTGTALTQLMKDEKDEIDELESVSHALDIASGEEDLVQIRDELAESGFVHRKAPARSHSQRVISHPFHYVSQDGYDIYVGKNNYQNDELTFRFANGGDWWFHAKGIPGSHVILRVPSGSTDIPDRAFEDAASLAAYYSKGKSQEKVEIDYLLKKNVKKPAGSRPGFVVYYTNYSMMSGTDISRLRQSDS